MNKQKKILIVDDNEDIVLIIRLILEPHGFMVDTSTDSRLALSNYKPDYYDLVLIDFRMPNMDGFELYKRIRKIDYKTKISFLTASEKYCEQYGKEEFSKLDKELFIQKPIENEELLKRIYKIIDE